MVGRGERDRDYYVASLAGYIAGADDSLGWLFDYEGSFEGAHGRGHGLRAEGPRGDIRRGNLELEVSDLA